MIHGMNRRRRIEAVCLMFLVGMPSFSGCAFNRSAESGIPAWMRFSRSTETISPVQSESPESSIPQVSQERSADAEIVANSVPTYPPPAVSMQPSQQSNQSMASGLAATEPLNRPSAANISLIPLGRPKMQAVVHANKATFEREVLASEVPVLVDFYASWCGPCKKLAPTLNDVVAENPQARIVKVDIDESPELAARYGVQSVPSLIVFKDGRAVAKEKGVVSKSRLLSMLDL